MTVAINPQPIEGHWVAGVALDLHTTSSTYLGDDDQGHPRFDNVRSPVAELLYRLKYHGDRTAAAPIVDAAVDFLKPHAALIDTVVPVPASTVRAVPPVAILAGGIAAALGKPLNDCVTATRATMQLKGVDDREERARLLDGLYSVDPMTVRNKSVLLIDDVFRSGATLNAVADVLIAAGAASVRVLTVTRTRSKG